MRAFIKTIFGKTIYYTVTDNTTIGDLKNLYMYDLVKFARLPWITIAGRGYHYQIIDKTKEVTPDNIEVFERTTNSKQEVRNELRFILPGRTIKDENTLAELGLQNEITLHHVHNCGSWQNTTKSYYSNTLYRKLNPGYFPFDSIILNEICKKIPEEESIPSLYKHCLTFFKINSLKLPTGIPKLNSSDVPEPTSIEDLWKYSQCSTFREYLLLKQSEYSEDNITIKEIKNF